MKSQLKENKKVDFRQIGTLSLLHKDIKKYSQGKNNRQLTLYEKIYLKKLEIHKNSPRDQVKLRKKATLFQKIQTDKRIEKCNNKDELWLET